MSLPILKTKLFVPHLRPEIVVRTRLVEMLNNAKDVVLTLVCAPAGFGKSTVVSEWIHQTQLKVAWLSLDESDNEIVRFVRYVTATIQIHVPDFGNGLEEIPSMGNVSVEAIGTLLVNELSLLDESLYVVLDDVHCISTPHINELLCFLIDNAPPIFHLILISRHEPDLPLHRYRAKGKICELRLQDIRFTHEEAAQLFNTTLRLRLDDHHLRLLEEKTEGWVAGLQMAALSLQQSKPYGLLSSVDVVDTFVNSFAGTDSFILDYLMEEVLHRIDEETRNALMTLSMFSEFSGDLLNHVQGIQTGHQILHKLLHDNLYIFPLDNERQWFRFHHLFRDLLLHRRQSTLQDDDTLHRKSAEWFFRCEKIEQGLHHLSLINNVVEIHHLSKRFWKEIAANYQPKILKSIATQILKHDPSDSPELLFLLSLITLDNRTPEKIERANHYSDLAIQLLSTPSVTNGYTEEELKLLRAAISMSRLALLYHQMQYDDTLAQFEYHKTLLSQLPEQPIHRWYLSESSALQIVAHTLFVTSRIPDGVRMYERIIELFQQEGKAKSQIAEAMLNCARGELAFGDIESARYHITTVLNEYAPDGVISMYDNRAHALYLLSRMEIDSYEIENAIVHNEESLHCWEKSLWHDPAILYGILEEAYALALLRKQNTKAMRYLARYEELLSSGKAPAYAPRTSKALIASAALSIDDVASAKDWADEYRQLRLSTHHLTPSFKLYSDLILTEYYLRSDELESAREVIHEAVREIHRIGYSRYYSYSSFLSALLEDKSGNTDAAILLYQQSLRFASEQGNYRLFATRKSQLTSCFYASLPYIETELLNYVTRLKSLLHIEEPIVESVSMSEFSVQVLHHQNSPQTIVEHYTSLVKSLELTERELDTLRYLAQGYSNQKIADKMFVSLATVKTHLYHLFGKLDVKNRTEAVLKAREIGVVQ